MANGFRFNRSVKQEARLVKIQFEDQIIQACAGESVAAALLANGINFTRTTPISGSARTPFCMMGTCFECLMEIDGIPNRQACMVDVVEGMTICRMRGASEPGYDE